MKKRVFVGLSGGVDSSVAAALLLKKGYDVTGIHLKCVNIDGCAEQDADDARRVAEQLGIPFYSFNMEREYAERVVDYMVRGYRAGITPNPDVMCNKEIKFGLFLARALKLGATHVATGHYVALRKKGRSFSLYAAKDANKDQSYFLWTLGQAELAHCLFPLGDITKPDVRKIAKKLGLVTAQKKDSQGICFLGKISAAEFLKNYIPTRKGTIVTDKGETIGSHEGAEFYTIGQRHGLHVGGRKEPLYVTGKDIQKNTVMVAEGAGNERLYAKEATLSDINFVNQIEPARYPMKIRARVRYRQPLFDATLERLNKNRMRLVFQKPEKSVAPGQSAVLYATDGEMLGGGVIL